MTDQLREIGRRLSALREIMEYSGADMAAKMNVPVSEYEAYENGEIDFSFSFLYNAANVLGVDVLDILNGESPKLSTCCLVRKGEGLEIFRRKAYGYKHLAHTFRNKKAEPFLVSADSGGTKAPDLHSHEGQEFDYMISGSMNFYLGDMVYVLNEGDSIYFDSSVPHAMKSLGDEPAQFIAVVIK